MKSGSDESESEPDSPVLLPRYQGFPGLMQGGYLAGLAAGDEPGPTRVQIRKPIRPGDSIVRVVDGDKRTVTLGQSIAMVAFPDELRVTDPEPLDSTTVDQAMAAPLPWPKSFPDCAGCGDRADGLGASIKPFGKRMIATWTPGADLAVGGQHATDRLVGHESVWTVVDCFTSWALFVDPPADASGSFVTGNIALELRRPLLTGVDYVMQSWRERDVEPGELGQGRFKLGSVIVGGSIEDADGIVALADQELVRTSGFGMNLNPPE
jgi:hypothetical protein